MKNKSVALYAGSFDPFTYGHQDIVARALTIFDQIIILVAKSPRKTAFLSLESRIDGLKTIYAKNKNVQIFSWDGLVVDYAKKNNIKHIIRGLRPTGDFDNEFQMASMNRDLNKNIDTVFLAAGPDYFHLSSSLVREIFYHGGNIAKYVPDHFIQLMRKIK